MEQRPKIFTSTPQSVQELRPAALDSEVEVLGPEE